MVSDFIVSCIPLCKYFGILIQFANVNLVPTHMKWNMKWIVMILWLKRHTWITLFTLQVLPTACQQKTVWLFPKHSHMTYVGNYLRKHIHPRVGYAFSLVKIKSKDFLTIQLFSFFFFFPSMLFIIFFLKLS